LGGEKLQEEKRQKRSEIRAKRTAGAKKAMEEAESQQAVEHSEGEDKDKKE